MRVVALNTKARNPKRLKNWQDYEKRFKELAGRLGHSRIEFSNHKGKEHWKVVGLTNDQEALDEFKIMCASAGKKASDVLSDGEGYSEILNHGDPKIRWYRLLKESSVSKKPGIPAYTKDKDGNKNWIGHGVIENIGHGSANLCLWLHENAPIERPWYQTLYEHHAMGIVAAIIATIIGAVILRIFGL